jgi:hypothetical protein
MKLLKTLSIVVIITLFAIGCGSSGDGPTPPSAKTTTVTGTVLDGNGNPIEGAEVTIMSDPVTVTTDAKGKFTATVDIGTHTIEIKMDSILIHSGQINCEENTPLLIGNITTDYDPIDITSCNDDNNIDQPDLTGNPYWSSNTATIDSEVMLSVPVDEDTKYLTVTLHHTQNEGGQWIAIGGFGLQLVTPGQAQTVSVPVNINFTFSSPQTGNYFPTITLQAEESGIDKIDYTGGSDKLTNNDDLYVINNGDKYVRKKHNESPENADMKISCFLIPILSVTE